MSSYSEPRDNCVEIASLPDGAVAVRDSEDPAADALRLDRSAMNAWPAHCKAGAFDAPARPVR